MGSSCSASNPVLATVLVPIEWSTPDGLPDLTPVALCSDAAMFPLYYRLVLILTYASFTLRLTTA